MNVFKVCYNDVQIDKEERLVIVSKNRDLCKTIVKKMNIKQTAKVKMYSINGEDRAMRGLHCKFICLAEDEQEVVDKFKWMITDLIVVYGI
jgi:hypothetical protein